MDEFKPSRISSPGARSPNTCENFQCAGGGEDLAAAMVMLSTMEISRNAADMPRQRRREDACVSEAAFVMDGLLRLSGRDEIYYWIIFLNYYFFEI